MKKVVFIVSHLCSGSDNLIEILNQNSRIKIQNSDILYDHPTALDHLFDMGHKVDNTAAIYGDHLLFNSSFSCKRLCDFCKFIYLVKRPDSTIGEIVAGHSYTEENAGKYYCFRLRRICEMIYKTPGPIVFLTWDDIEAGGFDQIEEYLNLKEPLVPKPESSRVYKDVSLDILTKCENSYERHLYYVRQLIKQRI